MKKGMKKKYEIFLIIVVMILVLYSTKDLFMKLFNLFLFHFSRNFHEKLTHKIMLDVIIKENIKCMIDAGGWLGDTATQIAENNPEIKVYTIEPSLENCNFIKDYIKNHNITNVKVIQKALSSDSRDKFNTKSASVFADKQYEKSNNGIDSITIDNIYKNNYDLGLVHLDVEGYEFECLKGAQNTISKGDIIFIVEILDRNKNKNNIINLFKKNYYDVYVIPEKISWAGKKGNNFLFLPKNNNKINNKDFLRKYGIKK